MNWISPPHGDFTARLATARISIMPTARMLIGTLVQFNSSSQSLNSNVRLRWEYTSGSELFVVYSDGSTTLGPGFPDMTIELLL